MVAISKLHHMISMNPTDRRRGASITGVAIDKASDSFFNAIDTSKINKASKRKTTKAMESTRNSVESSLTDEEA